MSEIGQSRRTQVEYIKSASPPKSGHVAGIQARPFEP
jgi:hypothetical protein